MTGDVELSAGDARMVVVPAAGGRIRQISVAGVDLLAEASDHDPHSTHWGSFPMAPWAGRIRNGRFDFLGISHTLDLNHQDGDGTGGGTLSPPVPATPGTLPTQDRDRHAIHGTTFAREWTVASADGNRIAMSCELVDPLGVDSLGWSLAGRADQVITLAPDHVALWMRVAATDEVFPASIGWHPWFAKPDRMDFDPVAMYEQDSAGIPTGRLVTPPAGPWDDCFVNHHPIVLHYERATAATVTVSSPVDHWVVYDRPDRATCIEPQTGPPDAPTIRPKVVAPGAPLGITMKIGWV
ncbi:MAG: aldose epimerase [Ilumatobacter sp.]|uniref:aldose epimerase family protein n=1 Tax=Ilumatobacter sp. TaxID=1967498 RepID=UPI00329714F4